MATQPVNSFANTQIARAAAALYDLQLGEATMTQALAAATQTSVDAVVNSVFNRDFAGVSNADLAALIVKNVGITTASGLSAAAVADAVTAVTAVLGGAAAGAKGAAVVALLNNFAQLGDHAVYGAAAKAFNAQIQSATGWASQDGTQDIPVHPPATTVLNISSYTAAGANVMRLTGNQDIRLDFGNNDHQIRGLDLDGDGTFAATGIEQDGKENNFAYLEANVPVVGANKSGFKVVDAYARNPLNISDTANNFRGNIYYDGTGFFGDGKSSNGNIFLGGVAADIALGGIGNDFFAGGGNSGGAAQSGNNAGDDLSGGRNADFFFVELSRLSATDGNGNILRGGTTSDDTVAAVTGSGGYTTQDNDWILLEASDDDEPVTITLTEGNTLVTGTTASGQTFSHSDMESLNASGNLFGFLDDVEAVIGARASDAYEDGEHTAGSTNYGRGSTAQLIVTGSAVNNAIIGGYDNDSIDGDAGDDLLMGGDLQFLITNKNNKNLLNADGGLNLTGNSVLTVNDGKDTLVGGTGNDNIVFESDGGTITGGADTAKTSGRSQVSGGTNATDDKPYNGPRFQSQGDTTWLTNFSMGRVAGAQLANEATAQGAALNALTTDATYRIDLGNSGAANFKNYGGANSTSQDQTNYKSVTSSNGTVPRVTTTGMESVNATGLGRIDYKAAGSNTPDLTFANQQNYFGLNANVDLRGSGVDNALLANTGSDTLEGRGGDDVISGGAGNDRVLMSFGDGIDWHARPTDANGDNLWDTTGGLVVADGVAWGQDFRPAAAATAGTTTVVVDFGTTVLNGVDTFVATFQVRIDGVDFGASIPVATLAAAKSTAEVAAIVNPVFQAVNKNVSVVATSATTIEVRAVDSTPGDGKLPVIGTSAATGFFVTGQASGAGTYQAKGSILGQEGTNLEDDRFIVKDYTSGAGDRAVNLGADQTKNEIHQAAQMVANFGTAGSTLAQASSGYTYRLYLDGVREGDVVSVTVNGAVYSYTLKANETAENAATELATVINNALDVHSASGTLSAVASTTSDPAGADTFDGFDDTDTTNTVGGLPTQDNNANRALVEISQTFVNNSAVFLDISATTSRTDGVSPFGTVSLHNQTNTMAQLLGFNGSNGGLNAQDKNASPVVLFQGRQTSVTLDDQTQASFENVTSSLLLTAKNAGGTLTGMNARADADAPFNQTNYWINGDDLLIGGTGNDTINAGTGDDRIEMSKGTDTVDGGGNLARPLNADGTSNGTQVFSDTLLAEERTFGTGTSFKVTLDGAIGSAGAGKGTVAAIKADLTPTGDVTTFTGIETVRVLENNRNSELDVKALSDNIALAVVTGPTGGIITADERLVIDLNSTTPSTKYKIDFNADGDTADSGEEITATAVLGVESVTTGAANDTIKVDHTQATANNRFVMNGQQDNAVTFAEGSDIVEYTHAALAAALRPTMTVSVTGASSASVKMTGGALGTNTFTDTLTGVEEVTVTTAATATSAADVVDLSALTGGTVNFGAGGVTVGRSLGGQGTPASVVVNEANTLETGGVSATSTALGNELLEINGITHMERVTGSAGADRVIVGDGAAFANANFAGVAAGTATTPFNFHGFYSVTDRAFTGTATIENNGLYQWNLAGGDDSVDFRNSGDGVAVLVDFSTNDRDLIVVDADQNGTYFDHAAQDRIDIATGVERYYGAASASAGDNVIDLSRADAAVTVTFGAESTSTTNEVKDPNGFDGQTGSATKTADNQVTGINVSTGTNPSVARFMQASAHTATGGPLALWERIEGSNQNDTVVFSAFQDRNANETLNLRGGNNTVDYNGAVLAGASDAYTLTVSDYAPNTNGVTKAHTGITVAHTSTDDVTTDTDTISIDRQYSANVTSGSRAVIDGTLLVIGSSNSNDVVSITGFGAPTAATGVTGTKFGTTTQVDENTLWTDILGNVGGGHNRVDLGSGAGVTTGSVVQDVAQTIVGGETDGNTAASAPVVYDNVLTSIKGFERITGSANSDRLFGNDSDNVILAGGGHDLVQGRGGADTITLDTGNDRVVYVGSGDTGHINNPSITNLTASGFDSITDFDDSGTDLLVIDRVAGWSNLLGNTVQIGALGAVTFNTTNGQGVILFNDNAGVTSANATNMTAVVAALGASATIGGANTTAGQQTIFAIDATDRVAVYVWTASAAADMTISANEVQLLTMLDDDDIDAVGAEAAEVLTFADLAMRYGAQSGQQLNQQLVGGVRDEVVYSALAQSQYGAIDSFGTFNGGGALTNPYVAGEDKIDLSAFSLAGQGALAINAAIVRDRSGAGNQITDANANDFFVDAGGVRRAVVIEFDNDDIDGGLAGVQGKARVFVDLNGDGQLSTLQDLFLDFATAGVVVTGTLATGVGNNGVPGFTDFIFGN